MKVKEFIEKLSDYADFDLEFCFVDATQERYTLRSLEVTEVADIGHSDKVILLSGKERS
ncbi:MULTISPECIES: hypothetical protein [unclassified Ruminococcus]|uniref:hypothetical protein n=1 Tax=unclassified Ruminococcus TaxID=2608920 RepID=UPI0018A984CB|nr:MULTISPECIES: hypothetical protein [unclassified Ruminococcus]MDB8775225.1 hypothetical protein [Ruminococcus sp. 1001136sp1]